MILRIYGKIYIINAEGKRKEFKFYETEERKVAAGGSSDCDASGAWHGFFGAGSRFDRSCIWSEREDHPGAVAA